MRKRIRRALLVLTACAAAATPYAAPAAGAPPVGVPVLGIPGTPLSSPGADGPAQADELPTRGDQTAPRRATPRRPHRPTGTTAVDPTDTTPRRPTEPSGTTAVEPTAKGCLADAQLSLGSGGPSVSCVQRTLALLDVYHGVINGIYDQVTADSVRWIEIVRGFDPDGIADPVVLDSLNIWSGVDNPPPPPPCAAGATLQRGETSFDVMCLQSTLTRLGLLTSPIDGVFGENTELALMAYQAQNPPLTADGLAGPRTLAALGIWNGRSDVNLAVVPGAAPAGPWPAPATSDLPEWRLTAEGVPYYGNRGACTRAQADAIAYQFARDGADIATQQWAAYIASREGGCNYLTVNQNASTQDDSHCTFQLNALAGTFEPTGELGRHGWTTASVKASLDACADAASDLWVYCGRGPWTPPYYCRPPWQTGG